MTNPLIEYFDTPYETAPFERIKNQHFEPAFDYGLESARAEIESIENNPEEASFKNTMEALEFAGDKLSRISSIFFNLNSAETSEELQALAQKISPKLTAFANDINLSPKLFKRVAKLYEQRESLNLTEEQNILLEKRYKAFVRGGANLNDSDKEKLRKLDADLAALSLKFGEHVLADNNAYELHIKEESALEGLPESAKKMATELAKSKNKEGFIITLDYPSYIPFMTYVKNRELRRELALAFGKKGFQKNDNNNEQIVLDIIKKRHERAQLLGYPSHAHYVLEERMAENPDTVLSFLEDLRTKASHAASRDFEALSKAASKEGIDQIEKWDSAFYSEKLKQEKFDLDSEKLKPFFPLNQVLNGAFQIAGKLFGLSFEKAEDIQTYHPDVEAYIVKDRGEFKAVFYTDFHPRAGKRNGAWMTSFKSQWKKDAENSRPHISIVCNFSPPVENTPSLLNFNEVTTLFHEFGHALHGMLADTTYPSLSGTSVAWDFVELPSQLLENWCYQPEALDLFARHYQTGELIDASWIKKIQDSANFMEGLSTMRQLSFGILDMHWHATDPSGFEDVFQEELEAMQSTAFYPVHDQNCMSTSFSHIFQGGYSAGYYSYKWAEVLDADAFDSFKQMGIFDQETAKRLKDTVLSKGGTVKPMKLYEEFKGSKPTNEALLTRAGLKK
jgi:peptidyl-dipeptidase Dcp